MSFRIMGLCDGAQMAASMAANLAVVNRGGLIRRQAALRVEAFEVVTGGGTCLAIKDFAEAMWIARPARVSAQMHGQTGHGQENCCP
jgi:hypothetical protein